MKYCGSRRRRCPPPDFDGKSGGLQELLAKSGGERSEEPTWDFGLPTLATPARVGHPTGRGAAGRSDLQIYRRARERTRQELYLLYAE